MFNGEFKNLEQENYLRRMYMKRIEGYIDRVHKNYGVIKSKHDNYRVKYLFLIFPDMLKNGHFESSNKVTFLVTTNQIRGVKMLLAYDIKPVTEEKVKKFKVNEPEFNRRRDYNNYIFKSFYKVNNDKIIGELIDIDIKFKEFILKWVLFLENEIKNCIFRLIDHQNIKLEDIYKELSENTTTKKINKEIFNKLKKNYMFRHEFELLTICREDTGDVRTFKVLSAPLELYLANTTLDELGKIVRTIFESFIRLNDNNEEDFLFLKNTIELFLDLSIIRNACAHGNPLIPLILDDNYSPNYLFDLASVYPEFNSGDSVKDWKLFEPLRWTIRQLAKTGQYPIVNNSPLYTGLYIAKYILINPSRRSFFSLLFILEYYFMYIMKDKYITEEFNYSFNEFIPIFDYDKDVTSNLCKYPKKRPVINQIYNFIYPIYAEGKLLVNIARILSKAKI